ncbi:hypothetical protein ACFW89_33135 [Streptomyces albidoflavus]|uniref:hypothetical protein n=2 Tax=unclassified Streptomyces TaxID=2593676 RepID=UPI00365234D7
MPVLNHEMTGEELAESLLKNVGNERMRAATRLLGAYQDGYWLRRLLDEEDGTPIEVNQPHDGLIERAGTEAYPSVNWDTLGLILLTQPWALKCSTDERAILEFATSLVGKVGVNLSRAVLAVDDTEILIRALQQTSDEE